MDVNADSQLCMRSNVLLDLGLRPLPCEGMAPAHHRPAGHDRKGSPPPDL